MSTDGSPPAATGEPRSAVWLLLGGLLVFTVFVLWMLYHFVLGPGLMSNVVRQRQAQAQSQILALHTALEGWSARNQGRYPPSLDAVVMPDEQGRTLLGGALALPKDPWGNEYVYARPTPGQQRPALRSLGRDGKPGGAGEDADIEREGVVGAR
jgi:general secretion pathway protein G